MSASAIYAGHVAHMRPGKHRLRYRLFMLALDIDDLPRLHARLKWFAYNRANLVSIFDRDHGDGCSEAIKPRIEQKLQSAGLTCDGGPIVMLTMPRLLNYVFNPLTVYFCYRRDGEVAALVHEVSNTFGERHFYVLPAADAGAGQIEQHCDKQFFVSPFLEKGLRYKFTVTPPGERCTVAIVVHRGADVTLTASFAGQRSALTDANLLRACCADPLMTLKVIAGIHWEALKMWLKGIRYIGRQPADQH
ncbi:MAG: DUF1365 family protein [Terricaulis sp.]